MNNFQLYDGENKLHINEMMLMYKTNTLSWSFIVLAYWNNIIIFV